MKTRKQFLKEDTSIVDKVRSWDRYLGKVKGSSEEELKRIIMDGHHRYEAAKRLNIKRVPVIVFDDSPFQK